MSMSYLLNIKCRDGCPHGSRCMYTHGYLCEDCGKFINKGTLEHFMTEGSSSIDIAIHNRHVSFLRGNSKKDIPNEILHLQKKLNNNYLETLNEEDAIIFMKETYELLKKHKIKDDEAIQILK